MIILINSKLLKKDGIIVQKSYFFVRILTKSNLQE